MKVIPLMVFCIIANSCVTSKIIPLKGHYPQPPIITTSTKSFDKVWEETVDYFAQNGIPIKIIDKASGIIVSDKAKLSWSFEKPDGGLFLSTAFVVLEKILDPMHEKPFAPETVTGERNVRIKSIDGGTSINVNLYNIEAVYGRYYYSSYTHTAVQPVTVKGTTTGNFEQKFEASVK